MYLSVTATNTAKNAGVCGVDDEFQYVETDLNITPIKENDLGLLVFRSTPAAPLLVHHTATANTLITTNHSSNQNIEVAEKMKSLVKIESKRQLFKSIYSEFAENLDIIELVTHLVDTVVNNHIDVLQADPIADTSSNTNSTSSMEDPNEVSFTIEKEPSPIPPPTTHSDFLKQENAENMSKK